MLNRLPITTRVGVLAALLLAAGCAGPGGPPWLRGGPGHAALPEQLRADRGDGVLSVQGYFAPTPEAAERLREAWQELAVRMAGRPGFRGARLMPGIAPSCMWIAVSEWDSTMAIRAAFADPAVQAAEARMPPRGFAHLFAGGIHQPAASASR